MKKIVFVIPTLFHNKQLTINCVNAVRNNMTNFNVEYEIYVVINEMNEEFKRYEFGEGVTKKCSNLRFNISKALNVVAISDIEYDYFCYVDEGMTINNDVWISYLISLFETNDNIGLVGCRPHSTFNNYNVKVSEFPELYKVLWSDGILFTTKEIMNKFNGFNELYFGDCEMQDFGYRLHFAGYTNLYWKNLSTHTLVDYIEKSDSPIDLIGLAIKSRNLFKESWNDIEYAKYKFKSDPC